LETCWSGAGVIKTSGTFVSVTSEKHASSAPACTVDEFFLSAIPLSLARQCYANCSLSHACRFFIAGNFICLDIVWFQDAGKYISVRLLLLTICLSKMMVGSQLIVNFSWGMVLLLVLTTKTWTWIFMEHWTWIGCVGSPLLACSFFQDWIYVSCEIEYFIYSTSAL
jgi:hypothetical protein